MFFLAANARNLFWMRWPSSLQTLTLGVFFNQSLEQVKLQLAKPDIWLQLQPEFEASHVAQHFATFETWRRIHSEFSGSSVPWRSAKSHAWGAKLQAQFVSGCASADFKELNFWPFVQSELSFRDASGPRQPDIWGQLQLESRDRESSTKLAAPDPGRKV